MKGLTVIKGAETMRRILRLEIFLLLIEINWKENQILITMCSL